MNEKFFQLPKEKQERIINAGFYVFSKNSYKKSFIFFYGTGALKLHWNT